MAGYDGHSDLEDARVPAVTSSERTGEDGVIGTDRLHMAFADSRTTCPEGGRSPGFIVPQA